jgi:hypothetical protein
MQNISLEDLDHVTGGLTGGSISPGPTHTTAASGGSGSGSCSDALLTSLNSISSSIKDLSSKNNQGLFGGNGMLLFGMAMMMQRQSSSTVVINGGRGGCGGHGSYSWHARW